MGLQVNRYPLPVLPDGLTRQVPCARDGCPLGTDIPALVAAAARGDHETAFRIARATNPFASSCGHGCHAPCETACRRRQFGAPVAIASLEGWAAGFTTPGSATPHDRAASPHDRHAIARLAGEFVPRNHPAGPQVAIVGGGAAGLACAHDLALLGHHPIVLDAGHEPGGVITRIIPSMRFAVAAARAECLSILAGRADYRPGMVVADASALDGLFRRGFAAIFLATGAWQRARDVRLTTAHDALSFLSDDHALAGDVVVIGDGDLALDAAREAAHRARAAGLEQRLDLVLTSRFEVTQAAPHAIEAARREGILIHNGWLLSRVEARNGAVTDVEITRDGGRSSRVLACAHVIDATPRGAGATAFGVASDGAGFVAVDPHTLQTSRPGVWAGGACAFGHRSIAHAVADGKRAAWQIHAALTGRRVRVAFAGAWVEADDHEGHHADRALATRRSLVPEGAPPPADPFSSGALPLPEAVIAETRRCFDCTVLPLVNEACTACGKCVGACPTGAIALARGAAAPAIDGDRCTRCTACVDACPEAAITLARAIWDERLELLADAAQERALRPLADPARAITSG